MKPLNTRNNRRPTWVLAVLLLALAGCQGSDGNTSPANGDSDTPAVDTPVVTAPAVTARPPPPPAPE